VVLPLPAQGLEKSAGQDCSAGSRTADALLAKIHVCFLPSEAADLFMLWLISFAEVQDIESFLLNTLAEHNILFYFIY